MAEIEDVSAEDYSVEVIEDYTPSYYEPPTTFSRVGPFVGGIVTRKVDTDETTVAHQSSILAFVSGNRQEQMEYLNALLGVGIFMLCILLVWVTILLGLKCMGRDRVGCAAGYPFRSGNSSEDAKDDNPDEAEAEADPKDEQEDKNDDERGKTTKETGSNNSNEDNSIETGKDNPEEENKQSNNCQAKAQNWMDAVKTWMFSDEPTHVERRKFQSRCTYAVFALISIICSGLLIAYIYRPLQSAIETSGSIVSDVTYIVEDVAGVIESLDVATNETGAFLELFPQDFELLCPDVRLENFEARFGFNPLDIFKIVSDEFIKYAPQIQTKLQAAVESGDSIADILMDVNSAISSTDDYTWIIVLVICFTIFIVLSQLILMLVVMHRERNPSNDDTNNNTQQRITKFENCFGWTILPLHVFTVLISYILVIVFCFTTFLSTETCLPQFNNPNLGVGVGETKQGRGTPDDVVIAILGSYVNKEGRQFDGLKDKAKELAIQVAKNRLKGFIVGCDGPLAQRGEEDSDSDSDSRFLQLFENANEALDDLRDTTYPPVYQLNGTIELVDSDPLDDLKDSMNETLGDLKEMDPLDNLKDNISVEEPLSGIKESMNETLGDIKEKEPLNNMKEGLNETVDNLKDGLNGTVDKVQDGVDNLKDGLNGTVDKVKDGLNETADKVQDSVDNLKEGLNGTVDKVQDGVDNLKEGLNGTVDKVKDGVNNVKDNLNGTIDKVKDGVDGVVDDVKEGLNGTVDKVKDGVDNVKDNLNGTIDKVKDGANETWNNIKEKEPLNTVKDKANETWTNVKDSEKLEELEETLKEQIEKLLVLLEKAHKKLDEKLASVREQIWEIDGECGSGSLIGLLLRNVLVLNGVYGELIVAIKRGVVAVSCPSLNGLYVQAMYDLFCTDFATISANGFVLFFIISFSGFVLISLRASWRTAE